MKLICGQMSHIKILSCVSTLSRKIKYLRAITIVKSKDNSVSTLFEMWHAFRGWTYWLYKLRPSIPLDITIRDQASINVNIKPYMYK